MPARFVMMNSRVKARPASPNRVRDGDAGELRFNPRVIPSAFDEALRSQKGHWHMDPRFNDAQMVQLCRPSSAYVQ